MKTKTATLIMLFLISMVFLLNVVYAPNIIDPTTPTLPDSPQTQLNTQVTEQLASIQSKLQSIQDKLDNKMEKNDLNETFIIQNEKIENIGKKIDTKAEIPMVILVIVLITIVQTGFFLWLRGEGKW